MSKLQKLTFSVDVLASKAMGTVGKVQSSLDSLASKAKSAFRDIGYGAAAMWGSAQGIKSLVQPAMEFNNAMRDVDSLDVQGNAMDALAKKSLAYSVKFGEGAAGFVSSAYDIQSAIGGLEGADLANFTNASNVLAKATKADAGTITAYMGTMYGIFKKDAEAMGQSKWVDMIAGKTAVAVQMFKTTGSQMSGAFSSLGAAATSAGASTSEQLAVLGRLQATMEGSVAGTKYKAFLAGVGKAQKKLGMSFIDSQGKMLPLVQILEKIKGKFGETIDVAESDTLKSAMGSDEAVDLVKLLINDTTGLAKSIETLNNVTDKTQAETMAMKRVDPFQRMVQGANAVQIVIGRLLTPALDTLFGFIADVTQGIVDWAEAYPTAAKWVGYAGLAVLGFTGVIGLLTAAAGFGKIAMMGWSSAVATWNAVTKIASVFTRGWSAAQAIFNAVFLANPVVMVVAGIIAALAILMAVLPYISQLWDSFKNAFGDTWWGKALIAVFDPVISWLKSLGKIVNWVLDKLGFSFSGTATVEQVEKAGKGQTDSVLAGADAQLQSKANPAPLNTNKQQEQLSSKVIPASVDPSGKVPVQMQPESLKVSDNIPMEIPPEAIKTLRVHDLNSMKQTSIQPGGIRQDIANISNQNNSKNSQSGPVTNNYYGPYSNTNEQWALEMC